MHRLMKGVATSAVVSLTATTALAAQHAPPPSIGQDCAAVARQATTPDNCPAITRLSAALLPGPAEPHWAAVTLTRRLADDGPLVSAVSIQERSRSGEAIFAGVVVGAVIGGVVGRKLAGNGCSRGFSSCDTPVGIELYTFSGVLFGGALGGAVAWLWTDRDR